MAAPRLSTGGTTDLSVHVSATTDITLSDGRLVRVPVGVSAEAAAATILAASKSPFCVAPISYAESLVSVQRNLDAVGRELAASRHAETSLMEKYVALDKEHNSLRLKFLAVDKENVALVARISSLESDLATTRGDSAALSAEVTRLRSVIAKSDTAHVAEVKRLMDEVDNLKLQVDARDARVTALEGSMGLLTVEVAQLRARNTLTLLEDELCCAGEFATKLETRLVQYAWPGASSVGSPVRFLKDVREFFNTYFDDDGRLGPGKNIPKSYHHAPPPMDSLLGGDRGAFTGVYSRRASLQTACPAFVDVIGELKKLRGKIAHVQPPQDASPSSLQRALEEAHKRYFASEPAAAAGDERVTRARACLEPLGALREWWPA